MDFHSKVKPDAARRATNVGFYPDAKRWYSLGYALPILRSTNSH